MQSTTETPAIDIVEKNPYAPRPFVFTEAAICLRDAIRTTGFRSEHLVNQINPHSWSIVLGGRPQFEDELEHLDPRRCAIFNFEQLGSGSMLADAGYLSWLGKWLVVDYHGHNVQLLKKVNGPTQRAFELPVVPSLRLATSVDHDRQVDVLFYGTVNERRARVLGELERLGMRTEVVAGAYGPELSPAMLRARLVLHVHFYEMGLFPVARVLQPAACGVPVVCETSVFSPSNDWSRSGVVFCDYAALARTCRELLSDPQELQRHAERVQEFSSRVDFATPFRAVTAAMQANASMSLCNPVEEGSTQGRALLAVPDVLKPPRSEAGAEPLSDDQIEALLIREGALGPEEGTRTEPLSVVKREPGGSRIGKFLTWLSIAVVLLGSLKYWLDWNV